MEKESESMGRRQAWVLFGFSLVFISCADLCCAGGGFDAATVRDASHGHLHHHCDHQHRRRRHHRQGYHRPEMSEAKMLPEELAEEGMRLYGFSNHHLHDHYQHRYHDGGFKLSGLAIWLHALGCSLLVSFALLICLMILPVIFVQGKPSKAIVDSLALFGAGAMLWDAFLHQLPHAFGGEHSHFHFHHTHVQHEHLHSLAHSLKDLSLGMSILAGIVIFLLVEKVVCYVEGNSTGSSAWSHGHHHHHQKNSKKLEDDPTCESANGSGRKGLDEFSNNPLNGNVTGRPEFLLRNRNVTLDRNDGRTEDTVNGSGVVKSLNQEDSKQPPSNLVFGYLNLFSDGLHNFTDRMVLGSAFLLCGSVAGWSRTLFWLVHGLPQEVGDFSILVRSGISDSKALFINFLSALVAVAGTAMVFLWGQDPGQSSFIEGYHLAFLLSAKFRVCEFLQNNGFAIASR